jgi:hypothetical protein
LTLEILHRLFVDHGSDVRVSPVLN